MNIPAIRVIALVGGGVVLLGVLSLVVLTASSRLVIVDAVVIGLLVLVLALTAVTAAASSRVQRHIAQLARRTSADHAELHRLLSGVAATIGQPETVVRDGSDTTITLQHRLDDLQHRLDDLQVQLERARRHLDPVARAVPSDLVARLDHLRKETKETYWQLEALLGLHDLLRPQAPLPPMRGYTASPDVLHFLVERLWRDEPELVVECGSGVSSIILGSALRARGRGKVVALEHDPLWADVTRSYVQMHGLGDVVEIRDASLTPFEVDDESWLWYDLQAVDDLRDIDLLFVDGPPGDTSPLARYPAGPVLLPRCRPGSTIVLDDTHRRDERLTSSRWLKEFPDLHLQNIRADKGMHVLTRTRPE